MVRDRANGEPLEAGPGGEVAVHEDADGEARVGVRVDLESRPVIAMRGAGSPCSRVDG